MSEIDDTQQETRIQQLGCEHKQISAGFYPGISLLSRVSGSGYLVHCCGE